MSRVAQPAGSKGSLKWIQQAIAIKANSLQPDGIPKITWRSPLVDDDYAEYRDKDFLECIELGHLRHDLAEFWPARGPQWDALGTFDGGCVIVEAKAHLPEFISPPTQAGPGSRKLIDQSLLKLSTALGATQRNNWAGKYYQYTNRLAHLWWLREKGINAHLLLVGFIGDTDMRGPVKADEWTQAYADAESYLGIPTQTQLSNYTHHLFPDVSLLA